MQKYIEVAGHHWDRLPIWVQLVFCAVVIMWMAEIWDRMEKKK